MFGSLVFLTAFALYDSYIQRHLLISVQSVTPFSTSTLIFVSVISFWKCYLFLVILSVGAVMTGLMHVWDRLSGDVFQCVFIFSGVYPYLQ